MVEQSSNGEDGVDGRVDRPDDADEQVDREHTLDTDEWHQVDNGYPMQADNNF